MSIATKTLPPALAEFMRTKGQGMNLSDVCKTWNAAIEAATRSMRDIRDEFQRRSISTGLVADATRTLILETSQIIENAIDQLRVPEAFR